MGSSQIMKTSQKMINLPHLKWSSYLKRKTVHNLKQKKVTRTLRNELSCSLFFLSYSCHIGKNLHLRGRTCVLVVKKNLTEQCFANALLKNTTLRERNGSYANRLIGNTRILFLRAKSKYSKIRESSLVSVTFVIVSFAFTSFHRVRCTGT